MEEKFLEFENEVLCRRDSNQRRALKLWGELSLDLSEIDKRNIEIEWSHYQLNEIDTDTFGLFLLKKRKNIC